MHAPPQLCHPGAQTQDAAVPAPAAHACPFPAQSPSSQHSPVGWQRSNLPQKDCPAGQVHSWVGGLPGPVAVQAWPGRQSMSWQHAPLPAVHAPLHRC